MIFTARNFSLVIFIYIKSSTSGDGLVIAIDGDIFFDEHRALTITQACRSIQRKVANQGDRTAGRCNINCFLQGSVTNAIYASDSFCFVDNNSVCCRIPFISSWNKFAYIARICAACNLNFFGFIVFMPIILNCGSMFTSEITTRNIHNRLTIRITTGFNNYRISGSRTTITRVNKIRLSGFTLNITISNIHNTTLAIDSCCTSNIATRNI